MMDVTEYWATLVSIVVGLGFADLLINLVRLIHERKRVDWDALPLMWALVTFSWTMNYWWGVAANYDGSREATVVGQFALLLVQPVMLFMMSASVLPRSIGADDRLSMRAEWGNARRIFLFLFALNQIVTWIRILLSSQPLIWDFPDTARTITLGVLIALLFVKDRRAEWVGVLAIFGLIAFRLATQQVRQGGLRTCPEGIR